MPIYRTRLSAVGDCLNGVVGNNSFNSTVTLCFDDVRTGDGFIEIDYSLENSERQGGGFAPDITVHGTISGPTSSEMTTNYSPIFPNDTRSETIRFEGVPNGDYDCCVGWTSDAWMD